ncbi:hypothetical protein JOD27_000941 [Lentzea nigeriaca]|nr:hypothetical protein [Lentzea nigeriaca]
MSTLPDSCHCQAVPGGGTQRVAGGSAGGDA